MSQERYAIGIDIGGTKINAAILDLHAVETRPPEAPIVYKTAVHKKPTPASPDAFIETIAELVKACLQEGGFQDKTLPIGISTAGIVDPNKGEILGSTGNLKAISYHPFPIKRLVQEATGLPVHVENDANAAAYGEYWTGAARSQAYQNVIMITLGTGVGCGLILNGQLHRGRHFVAGEAGHIRISLTNDRRCTCGRIGCWEIYASGTGLATTGARELAEVAHSPEALNLLKGKDVDEITTHDIIAGVSEENPLARSLMKKWHFAVATGLGSLMNVLDPDVIVIGGGMASFIDQAMLRRFLDERVMGNMNQTPIRMAELGNNAGFVGAAQIAYLKTHQDRPITNVAGANGPVF